MTWATKLKSFIKLSAEVVQNTTICAPNPSGECMRPCLREKKASNGAETDVARASVGGGVSYGS